MHITEEQRQLLRDSIVKWGEEKQIRMAVEECSEFINAIMKMYRNRTTTADVVDEIADVILMMEEMAIHFGEDAVKERINFKMDRVKTRILHA